MTKRQSGVLLPIFSLPGEYGCGTFSRHAVDFVGKIAKSGFSLWQVLPFGITDSFHSPYMSLSSFGGNPYFIDPEALFEAGLVTREELEEQKVVFQIQLGPQVLLAKLEETLNLEMYLLQKVALEEITVERQVQMRGAAVFLMQVQQHQ